MRPVPDIIPPLGLDRPDQTQVGLDWPAPGRSEALTGARPIGAPGEYRRVNSQSCR